MPPKSADSSIYFCKPEQENGFLGQWYQSPITETTESGTVYRYQNCEHYMMHHKALLFGPNDPITTEILSPSAPAPDPRTLKALGRKVPDFDDRVWARNRVPIVVQGNYLKFTQNPELKAQLLATGERELVEASPRDRVWGVGFGATNAPKRRARWGLNLLGKALMEVRARIRREEKEEGEDGEDVDEDDE